MFTQAYLLQNIHILKLVFLAYSIGKDMWNDERYSERSFKQMGYINIRDLPKLLQLDCDGKTPQKDVEVPKPDLKS